MSQCNLALIERGEAHPRTCEKCGLGPCKALRIPDPSDSWVEVELFRWQYGELPSVTDHRPLDVPEGVLKMADAIELGCKSGSSEDMPTPFNVCLVLRHVAKLLKGRGAVGA